ncbi:MAG: hypothetical protein SPF91_08700 [Clostridium sp.]|nr:hypothetical protein [Clostridium sp.]
MKNEKKDRLAGYLLWSFGIAWILQIAAGMMFRAGAGLAYSALLAVSMFAPLLAAVLSGAGVKGMGWKPRIKGNIRWIMGAWFGLAVWGTMGAILYFLMVPDALDTSFSYIYNVLGTEGIRQMESSGMSVLQYVIISCVAALTYAPWVNMLFAIGEEAGWRGVMYPMLKSCL